MLKYPVRVEEIAKANQSMVSSILYPEMEGKNGLISEISASVSGFFQNG